jgi:hypothetical protein
MIKGNKNSGQTLVEYLLMMLLVVGVMSVIYKSQIFQENIGKNGSFNLSLVALMKYSYRHALPGKKVEQYPPNYTSSKHDSYQIESNNTRFFGPAQGYPGE